MATTGVSESSPPGPVKAALSFEEFFRAEYARLVRALMVLTSNRAEAEDIAQEAMTRAYERWRRVSTMELPADMSTAPERTSIEADDDASKYGPVVCGKWPRPLAITPWAPRPGPT